MFRRHCQWPGHITAVDQRQLTVERDFNFGKSVCDFSGLNQAIQLVIDGKVDALIADRETCAFAVLRYPDAGLIDAEAAFTVEPMGIGVPLDEPRLANLVQTYLNALAERGTLEKAQRFWLKDPSWVKDL